MTMSPISSTLTKRVDRVSASSVRIVPMFGNTELSTATGFCISTGGKSYLITNWHVVTGRNPDTDECLDKTTLAVPDSLEILFHGREKLGTWKQVRYPLLDSEGNKTWVEHKRGRGVDVVALPLAHDSEVAYYPLDLDKYAGDAVPMPAMPVCVVGFPMGLTGAENWPIWKTGHIATDPDLDYEGKPVFLIDATTRSGMSGSPVFLRVSGGYNDSKGNYVMSGGVVTKFMGVYAGRIREGAEVGRVWKPEVLRDLFPLPAAPNWKASFAPWVPA